LQGSAFIPTSLNRRIPNQLTYFQSQYQRLIYGNNASKIRRNIVRVVYGFILVSKCILITDHSKTSLHIILAGESRINRYSQWPKIFLRALLNSTNTNKLIYHPITISIDYSSRITIQRFNGRERKSAFNPSSDVHDLSFFTWIVREPCIFIQPTAPSLIFITLRMLWRINVRLSVYAKAC